MRQPIFHILFIAILLIMAFPFDSSGSEREIDFNFPQDVSKQALSDLDQALKSGDGQRAVDALVRYSIAQSDISLDNMADIVSRIEATIAREKQPHIKALLYYFEAKVYENYRMYSSWSNRSNPAEELPADVSEWDYAQFNRKINELLVKSLADPDALQRVPVTSMQGILKYNDLGATFVPTLLEFMLIKNIEMYRNMDEHEYQETVSSLLTDQWLRVTADNAPAHIYALTESDRSVTIDDYNKYRDSEYSALLLDKIYFADNKEAYRILKQHVERYPNSVFTTSIRNRITELESRSVWVAYPSYRSSHDSIPIRVEVKNTNSYNINVYSVPEAMLGEYRLNLGSLRLVKQIPMTAQGTIPFSQGETVVTLAPLPYGAYILTVDDLVAGSKQETTHDLHQYDILRVTDMAPITINRLDGKDHIGAVDINTGKPLAGITVNYSNNRDHSSAIGTTGAQGLLAVPDTYDNTRTGKKGIRFDRIQISLVKGEDKYGPVTNYIRMSEHINSSRTANIYTDLGVYRPGETVQWAAIVYYTGSDGRQPMGDYPVQLVFMDKNREPIDTITGRTDAYGRIEGSFVVPTDRMNGKFTIVMMSHSTSTYNEQLGRHVVNVSEYKTPTFAVTFPDARRSYTIGQPVKVSGKVETYSGMPVANTTVRLSLVQKEWSWWWWRHSNSSGTHLMDTTVTTDATGEFAFTFDASLFSENQGNSRWSRYNYQVIATATSDAGETQEESTAFIVGTRRGLELGDENGNTYINDKPIKLPLVYNTTDEQHPSAWCTWEITPASGSEPVKTGNLNTADPTLDLTALPSGQYKLHLHILDAEAGEQDVDVTRDIVLYRTTDKQAPVKDTPLWIPPTGTRVDKNNTGHVTVGVSTPRAYIYYVASTATTVVAEGWLTLNRGMHTLDVPMPREAGADVTVQFTSYYGTKLWQDQVTITNPYKAEALKITATSFRDKLTPGDTEHWTFTLTDQNGKPHRGAMLLDMFDKALSSIATNEWAFANWRRTGRAALLNATGITGSASNRANWTGNMLEIPQAALPQEPYLYTYNQFMFSFGHIRNERALGSVMYGCRSKSAMPQRTALQDNEVMVTSYSAAVTEEASEQQDSQVNEQNLDKVQLRESDVKTALWQPLLTSDDKGMIALEFEVPNFNTTWVTQAVAWDDKMVGSTWMAEVLTQKPLMVRSNMPRFLRQGDKACLAATVQNATDAAAACDAVIELFDPRSGDIYATSKYNLQLEAMGSQAVTIDWLVPDTVAMVGFRIKAANGRYGDGEQVMVPVLTTISPVIETQPFYIEAAQHHYESALPAFPADARVTLEYCDNPTWYCVLALPTIFSDSYCTATRAAHSLFALQVAQGVAKSQPQIKEAVTYWKQHDEDSTLVSMLQRNQDLKIGTLLASPWMRDADRQTLRMSRLSDLFDEATVKMEYEKIIQALQQMQLSDGGFTWFIHPNCKSNVWTTGTVLELLGNIKHLGYLPDDSRLTTMINRALAYFDAENVRLYNEDRKKTKNAERLFTSYAYTRSLYPDVKATGASADLLKKTVKYMNKNWSMGLTINEKGFYAMTLYRNGYHKTARSIIESIRQFAIVKPNLGMYWDNLQTGYGWWEFDKVAYTCTILQALNEVDPRQDEIDLVRKWMLLMKQSNDWGSYSLAADAVYSILSTGSQWLERNALPTITVAGEPVNLDKMAEWLGYFRTTLPATTSGSVVIDRSGNSPAWGAVYSQFKAPMTQIQEKAIDEVSLSKEYYVYGQDGTLHQATSFKVGDKVKVRVIIKVNKDMDFVTMTDERAACFEPVDQLSGYRSEDRTWFYQETKDTQTNVFISRLGKGTHIIGYDVWVTNPGEFTSGIATIQCQYAPQLTAHSAGKTITVDTK